MFVISQLYDGNDAQTDDGLFSVIIYFNINIKFYDFMTM